MVYSKLQRQQIRVLKLEQSDQHDSIIICSLVVVSLSEDIKPQYEALSYVWGDPAERNEILLDGQPTIITRNLWTALKYIRKPDAPLTLWIDAICIDQDDIDERNEQVRQMDRIYSEASRVLIWLAPPDTEIENNLSALKLPETLEGKQYEDFPKDIALGLQRILSQPWWHRIWVIQEHVLANRDPIVGCGWTWLEWTQLSEGLLEYSRSLINQSGSTITDNSSSWTADSFTILRHVLLRKQFHDPDYFSGGRTKITEIVERTRGYQATDKRDQIFAITGLLDEKHTVQLPAPNYARSVSEVYQEATVAFIRSARHLAFLFHATEKDDLELGLPTWCVDFSKKLWDWGGYGNFAGGYGLDGREEDEETRQYMEVFSHDPSEGTLKVLGGVLGEVVVSRPFIPPSAWDRSGVVVAVDGDSQPVETRDERFRVFTEFINEVLRMSFVCCKIWKEQHGLQTAKERLAAGEIWRTVFGGSILFNIVDATCIRAGIETVDGDDRPREYWVVEAFVRMSCPWYAELIEEMGFLHPTPELADSVRLMRALWETLMLVTQINIGKSWFATGTGYVGRVNRKIVVGDQLCTVLGCKQPFILRPCDGGLQLIDVPLSQDFREDDHRKRVSEVKKEVFTLR